MFMDARAQAKRLVLAVAAVRPYFSSIFLGNSASSVGLRGCALGLALVGLAGRMLRLY